MFGDLEYDECVNTNGLEGARYTAEEKKSVWQTRVRAGNSDLQSHDYGCRGR